MTSHFHTEFWARLYIWTPHYDSTPLQQGTNTWHCSVEKPYCTFWADLRIVAAGHRLGRHYLAAYRKSLEEVIRIQLRQPKFEHGLQGVLELAESIDLSSALLSDLDVKTPGHLAAAAAMASNLLSAEDSHV